MEEGTNNVWNSAMRDGLLLSLVTIGLTLANTWITPVWFGMLCWVLKTFFSLYLLYTFMKLHTPAPGKAEAFKYGFKVCLFSSIVIAAFMYAYYAFIFPDKIAETMEALRATLAHQSLPAESMDMLDRFEDNIAQLACISSLIWCLLLGLLFSAIFRHGFSDNPFTGEEGADEEDELK